MARGFASMSKERMRECARAGGKAAHAMGKANKWTKETAAAAGRKGGLTTWARKKAREAGFDALKVTAVQKDDVGRATDAALDELAAEAQKLRFY